MVDGQVFKVLLILASFCFVACEENVEGTKKPTYIITETSKFESLDPLDADNTHNLPVQRMLYATPLEVSPTDDYTSFVLDSFRYDKTAKTLNFKVKENYLYSDGTQLLPIDIVLSITRLLKLAPDFPVVSEIEGLKDWVSRGSNLSDKPSGIELTGNNISIKFSNMYNSPLARFAMENFSIIPSKCIDLDSGKIICNLIPSSGPYIISQNLGNEVEFKRNPNFKSTRNFPETILFKYMKVPQIVDSSFKLDSKTVVASTEELIEPHLSKIKSFDFRMKKKAASRFSSIVLFETDKLKNKKVRQAFANEYRAAYEKVTNRSVTSMFPKIVSGYRKFNPHSIPEKLATEKIQLKWGKLKGSQSRIYTEVIKVFNSSSRLFEISEPFVFENIQEYKSAVIENKLDFMRWTCGYWPIDPTGDVRMMFTPGFHIPLNHFTADGELKELINRMKKNPGNTTLGEINEYIYDQAQINIYNHTARLYLFSESSGIEHLPMGITSPAPYTVMEAALQ